MEKKITWRSASALPQEGTATSTSCSGNSGGVYPNWHSKGDRPVAEEQRVLWVYSAHMIKRDQEDGFLAAIHLSVVSRSWLSLSVYPLDSGWNPEDRLTVAPRDWENAHQNREENWGPRSETMPCGMPKTRKTWFITNSAVSLAVGSLGWGINRAALENLSTMTRIVVLPCDSGSPVIKSMERWDQGLCGMESGCNSPWGERWETSRVTRVTLVLWIGNETLRELFTLRERLLRDRCLKPL